MGLAQHDGKRFALVLNMDERSVLFRGTAHYEDEPTLGRVLRIAVDDSACDGFPAFVIQEETWDGTFQVDAQHGCHYQFQMDLKQAAV